MRKRLALVSIAVVGIVAGAAGSASAAAAPRLLNDGFVCPSSGTIRPLGIVCVIPFPVVDGD